MPARKTHAEHSTLTEARRQGFEMRRTEIVTALTSLNRILSGIERRRVEELGHDPAEVYAYRNRVTT